MWEARGVRNALADVIELEVEITAFLAILKEAQEPKQ
jgi:hypothetical protein